MALSIGDSECEEWPPEQEENHIKMEPLLCESPALLPTLALNLSHEGSNIEPVITDTGPALMLTLPQTTKASIAEVNATNSKKVILFLFQD